MFSHGQAGKFGEVIDSIKNLHSHETIRLRNHEHVLNLYRGDDKYYLEDMDIDDVKEFKDSESMLKEIKQCLKVNENSEINYEILGSPH